MKQPITKRGDNSLLRLVPILFFAMLVSMPALAQDNLEKVMEQYAKVLQEKSALEKRLKDTVTVLNDTIKQKNKLLKDLQKELRRSSKDAVETLNQQVTNLTAERDRLKKENESLIRKCQRSDSIVVARDAELVELRPFREQQLKQTLEMSKQWASNPFSQIDKQALLKLIEDCRHYGGNNADFKNAAQGLVQLQTDLNQFLNAQSLLSRPFDEPKKNAARQQLKGLMAKYKSKPQYEELLEVDALLRDFDGYVYMFQDLIDEFNKQLEDGGRQSNNKTMAKETLKLVKEEQQQNISEIEKIPYLEQRLHEYLDALESRPLEHWVGEKEIKEMVK